jgi:hypothetical protein
MIEPTCSSPEFAWLADVFRVDGWGWRPKVEIKRSLVQSEERNAMVAKATTQGGPHPLLQDAGPMACPHCGGLKIYNNQTASKTVIDLRFGSASIRKWTTRYRFHRYRCRACRAVFYNSEQAWSGEKFGPNLRTFCVYQNIQLRLSQGRIAEFLNQILGYQVSRETVHRLKVSAAAYYQAPPSQLVSLVNDQSKDFRDNRKVAPSCDQPVGNLTLLPGRTKKLK